MHPLPPPTVRFNNTSSNELLLLPIHPWVAVVYVVQTDLRVGGLVELPPKKVRLGLPPTPPGEGPLAVIEVVHVLRVRAQHLLPVLVAARPLHRGAGLVLHQVLQVQLPLTGLLRQQRPPGDNNTINDGIKTKKNSWGSSKCAFVWLFPRGQKVYVFCRTRMNTNELQKASLQKRYIFSAKCTLAWET